MIKQSSEAVLMAGKGSTLEAIERVCDKRSMRGATAQEVIDYLNGLYDQTWHTSDHIREGIDTLRSYWIARQG
jgi:hypothetical protein